MAYNKLFRKKNPKKPLYLPMKINNKSMKKMAARI